MGLMMGQNTATFDNGGTCCNPEPRHPGGGYEEWGEGVLAIPPLIPSHIHTSTSHKGGAHLCVAVPRYTSTSHPQSGGDAAAQPPPHPA